MLAVEVRQLGSRLSPTIDSSVNITCLCLRFPTCEMRISWVSPAQGSESSRSHQHHPLLQKISPTALLWAPRHPRLLPHQHMRPLRRSCFHVRPPLLDWELCGGRNRLWFCWSEQRVEDEGLNSSVLPQRCSHPTRPDGVSPLPSDPAFPPGKMQVLVMLLATGATYYLGLLAAAAAAVNPGRPDTPGSLPAHRRQKRDWIWNQMHIDEERNDSLPHYVGKVSLGPWSRRGLGGRQPTALVVMGKTLMGWWWW